MNETSGVDPFWEQRYRSGHAERYPWDVVVSFVYRNAPRDVPRDEITILEVGCGTGNNLWFAAREGFRVAGIDGSESAIAYARQRFTDEHLTGDFKVGDFSKGLPWPNSQFDLIVDRAALTYCDEEGVEVVLAEMHRVLKPGGRCLINVYSDSHSSYRSGRRGRGRLTVDMQSGTLAGTAATRFFSRSDIDKYFDLADWKLIAIDRAEVLDMIEAKSGIHAEYRIVTEKKSAE